MNPEVGSTIIAPGVVKRNLGNITDNNKMPQTVFFATKWCFGILRK